MAATEVMPDSDHGHRRRPFSTWMKKLTNFKSSDDGKKRQAKKKRGSKVNNPYPESGHVANGQPHDESAASFATGPDASHPSVDQATQRETEPNETEPARTAGTASTDQEAGNSATPSHGASSLGGTSRTVGGGLESRRGGDSTFSSPAPSVRSLTTTLTTIQSVSPNNGANGSSGQTQSNAQSIQFSQPFPPTTTSPASAIPAHLTPTGVPNTYTAATANGLLTDNASILTLASSSKRRRRRSMDTDASVRAMAPSSVWGGSRESLPLSVLSANIESSAMANTTGLPASSSRIGAERNSIYSSTGVPPAVSGDRNSYYAKQNDAASVRSVRPGHVRTESVGNTGLNSPLVGVPAEKTEKDDAPPQPKEE